MEAYTGMAALYDVLMADTDYGAWAAYLIGLMTKFGVPRGAMLLECGCGTGSMTVRLAEQGYRITGFDRSEDMLRVAAQAARQKGLQIPFVRQDMRSLSAHRPADAVLSVCDGVNYLLTAADVAAFFGAAAGALKDGGLLLFDISSAYKLSEVLGNRTYGEDTEQCTYLWLNAYDEAARTVTMDLAFFVPQKDGSYRRLDETHVQRAHTAEELAKLLSESGFTLLGAYEAFTDKPYGPSTERIQFVAKKKGTIGRQAGT